MKLPLIIYFIPYILHFFFVFLHITRINKNKLFLKEPLRDLLFDYSFDFRQMKIYTNILLVIFFIPYLQSGSLEAGKYFLKFFSIIVGIRLISSTITDIPSSDPDCSIKM